MEVGLRLEGCHEVAESLQSTAIPSPEHPRTGACSQPGPSNNTHKHTDTHRHKRASPRDPCLTCSVAYLPPSNNGLRGAVRRNHDTVWAKSDSSDGARMPIKATPPFSGPQIVHDQLPLGGAHCQFLGSLPPRGVVIAQRHSYDENVDGPCGTTPLASDAQARRRQPLPHSTAAAAPRRREGPARTAPLPRPPPHTAPLLRRQHAHGAAKQGESSSPASPCATRWER